MRIHIEVLLNTTQTNTLEHPPIVSLNDGMPQSARCSTCELLDYLKSVGVSEEEINDAAREIEEKGRTVLESRKVREADLKGVLISEAKQESVP